MAARASRGESIEYERMILRLEAKVLRPEIGGTTAGTLDPERFQALIDLRSSSRSAANNLRAAIVRFVKFANAEMVRRGAPVRWPTRYAVHGKARSRDSRFTIEEAARLWIAAGKLGRRGAMVRLMILTGCRRAEAQRVQWGHVVLEDPVLGAYWQQPGHLTKNHQPHRVPLSGPAVALLRWLPPRVTKHSGRSDLIFAGRGGKPVGSFQKLVVALRQASGVEAGTMHDLRRTLVSALGDHGFDAQVADALLNHAASTTMGGVMAVYQRSDFWQKRREALDLWAGLLMEAVGRIQGRPVDRVTWGFDEPFRELRIRYPDEATQPDAAKIAQCARWPRGAQA